MMPGGVNYYCYHWEMEKIHGEDNPTAEVNEIQNLALAKNLELVEKI